VFSDDEIQNIAISGSYGAGKSSLLKSYKKKHAELEGKILNQLLHQIESNKIPRTNFKVKNTTESFDVTTITGCITFFY
jgi:ABC-type phosphate/phosphonate transport system ATPase subunit